MLRLSTAANSGLGDVSTHHAASVVREAKFGLYCLEISQRWVLARHPSTAAHCFFLTIVSFGCVQTGTVAAWE